MLSLSENLHYFELPGVLRQFLVWKSWWKIEGSNPSRHEGVFLLSFSCVVFSALFRMMWFESRRYCLRGNQISLKVHKRYFPGYLIFHVMWPGTYWAANLLWANVALLGCCGEVCLEGCVCNRLLLFIAGWLHELFTTPQVHNGNNRHSAPSFSHAKRMQFRPPSGDFHISVEYDRGRHRTISAPVYTHLRVLQLSQAGLNRFIQVISLQNETCSCRQGCCQTISSARPRAPPSHLRFTALNNHSAAMAPNRSAVFFFFSILAAYAHIMHCKCSVHKVQNAKYFCSW